MTIDYTDHERIAATVIASLIYPDYPSGPDLTTLTTSAMWDTAIALVRDPYQEAAALAPITGELYDCPKDAATAWEGLRQMTGAATNYAKIDPLIRAIGGEIADMQQAAVKRAQGVIVNDMAQGRKNGKETEYIVDHWQGGATLRELQTKVFDPERWIIENILPEGACLMAAKYKSKKSWLALALGLPIAMAGKALGRLDVHPGRVLYLDLEGRQQRIQKRTRAILGVQQCLWPDNFHVYTKWPRGDEGMTKLEHWFMAYPDTGLVVIDVLASFRRPMDKTEMMYQYDRDTVDPINEMAEKYHAAILLVHHFNKGKHDDIMDAITGSTGLPSAVNTMWALRRDTNDSNITILEMRGRDLENDDPLALRWDTYLNMHVIEGPASEVAISAERKAIMTLLSDDEPRTPKDIATELGRPVETVKQLLRKLLNDGLIDKPAYGKYARVPQRDHADHADHSHNGDTADHSKAESDRSSSKSDRQEARVIPPDHSVLRHQEGLNVKSDRGDRDRKVWDLSVAEVQKGSAVVWQVWDDVTNTVLSEHTTQADAYAEANRRMT